MSTGETYRILAVLLERLGNSVIITPQEIERAEKPVLLFGKLPDGSISIILKKDTHDN